MTGGRLKRLKKYLKDESFLMTYGDGLANIDINKVKDDLKTSFSTYFKSEFI